uniref:Mandelate racemase/muconate lactonizing enzyme N-terminal domain-containing protein n=1 Tax=Streptomyces sp. NBC_01401 TaxID=2903854 RepID=A0AAU3H621_9ACTN
MTDRGGHGLGEASHGGGTDEDMKRELDVTFRHVRGRSPFDIAAYRRSALSHAARGKLQATAFAALEQAQWDIVGRALDAPVAELLSGGTATRTRLPVYANSNRAVTDGFRAIKAAVFDDFPALTAPAQDIAAAKELGIARAEAVPSPPRSAPICARACRTWPGWSTQGARCRGGTNCWLCTSGSRTASWWCPRAPASVFGWTTPS